MRRFYLLFAMCLVVVPTMTGCGKDNEVVQQEDEAAAEEEFEQNEAEMNDDESGTVGDG